MRFIIFLKPGCLALLFLGLSLSLLGCSKKEFQLHAACEADRNKWNPNPYSCQELRRFRLEQKFEKKEVKRQAKRQAARKKEVAAEGQEDLRKFLPTAQAGDMEAQYQCGVIYSKGNDLLRDDKKTRYWLGESAAQGHANAQRLLATMYKRGTGGERDVNKAIYWYQQSLAHGGSGAPELAELLRQQFPSNTFERKLKQRQRQLLQESKGTQKYLLAAEFGDMEAQYQLGLAYGWSYNGKLKDDVKASYWYQKAADQGHVLAQSRLGARYEFGLGVEKDISKAVYWYQQAAAQGYTGDKKKLARVRIKFLQQREMQLLQEPKVIRDLLPAAEFGDRYEQYQLALAYKNGSDGVPGNDKKAVYWFEKSAKQSLKLAQLWLGKMYEAGRGVEKDMVMAIYWYQHSGHNSLDSIRKQFPKETQAANLKPTVKKSVVVQRPKGPASKWLGHAKTGDMNAHYQLGLLCLGLDDAFSDVSPAHQTDDKLAMAWFQQAANNGDSNSQAWLGYMYEYGRGDKRNIGKALYWYQQAAKRGHLYAQKRVATLQTGNRKAVVANITTPVKKAKPVPKPVVSGPRKTDVAATWHAAAKSGDIDAQFQLGLLYIGKEDKDGNTLAVSQHDDGKAYHWFKKSAYQGGIKPMAWLGYLYENGRGTGRDITRAIYWYNKAAAEGESFAQQRLPVVRRQPIPQVELQEGKDAIKGWFASAKLDRAGDEIAQYELGSLYFGEMDSSLHVLPPTLQDDKKAFYWFKKAAGTGDERAQAYLGILYEDGRGVERDLGKAAYWYKKAAAKGSTFAQEKLARLGK